MSKDTRLLSPKISIPKFLYSLNIMHCAIIVKFCLIGVAQCDEDVLSFYDPQLPEFFNISPNSFLNFRIFGSITAWQYG